MSSSNLLIPNGFSSSADSPGSLSRPDSYMNLTSPTLFGIYSPTTGAGGRDPLDDTPTPWGTGAQTPIRRPSVDEVTYDLMRDRAPYTPRQSFIRSGRSPRSAPGSAPGAMSRAIRVTVLFVLGLGYGILVSHFQYEPRHPLASLPEDILSRTTNWKHLVFWGIAGVFLGSLLPWLDKIWENSFGDRTTESPVDINHGSRKDEGPGLVTDWALVMRAVGAFVGIMFAIRKLVWSSTLQASLALALVNPVLWWLIDRSPPGFLLSAVVGIAGSFVLLGTNPEMMPAPSRHPFFRTLTFATPDQDLQVKNGTVVLGGLANQETVEAGIWMMSILFCSAVCFGNIGRRLTRTRRAVARGRWGGER